MRVGAHTATTSPTLDGKATLVVGGLVPSMRTDSGLPLGTGVQVSVVDTEAPDLETMLQRDALIASAPEGEIKRVRQALGNLAVAAAIRGLAVGAVAALAVVAGVRFRPARQRRHGPGGAGDRGRRRRQNPHRYR